MLTTWGSEPTSGHRESDTSGHKIQGNGYSLEQAQVVGIVGIVGMVGMVGIVGINK